jgi:hypothetical protein
MRMAERPTSRSRRSPRHPGGLVARAAVVASLAVSLAAVAPRAASADPNDDRIAAAKKRFEEGMALEDEARWKEARAAFEEVAAVKTTAQVRFQIAFCDEHLGRWVEALDGYAEALGLANADPDKAGDVLKAVPERVAALEPRLPHVVLDVGGPGAKGPARYAVLLDHRPVEPAKYGHPVAVDVGSHTIDLQTTSLEGKVDKRIDEITLSEGQAKKVRVEVPGPPAPAARPVVHAPPPPKAGTKIPAVVVGSVGLASLVVSGVFLGLRQDAISTVRDGCKDPDHDRGCDPKLAPIADDGRTYTYVSASLAAVGVAALGTAAALWFTVGASQPRKTGHARLVVSPGFTGVRGEF